ncbi:MAG: hypothetical protein ACYTBJ_13320 [Planctomycetota bacterium]|jgi:TolA-binding protein
MKRHVISIVSILVVLALVWAAFAQSGGTAGVRSGGTRSGRAAWRERRQKAMSTIEEQLAKMKSAMESSSASREKWQNLSQEERTKLRTKLRQERAQSIAVIEDQLAKLRGRRSLQQEHDKSISKMKALHELAVKEKATETAASIEKLIAEKSKAFEERMQKLGLPRRTGRRGT